jgi:hypothetical protein
MAPEPESRSTSGPPRRGGAEFGKGSMRNSTWRAPRWPTGGLLAFVSIASLMTPGRSTASPAPPVRWHVEARIPVPGDTILLRSGWQSRPARTEDSTCAAYRIERSDGRLLATDSLIEWRTPEEPGWAEFSQNVMRRGADVVVHIIKCEWPCYPNDCCEHQYVQISNRFVAKSAWTTVEWTTDPGEKSALPFEAFCVAVAIPVRARVVGSVIEFVVDRPSGLRADSMFVVPATQGPCTLFADPDSTPPATVTLYATSEATTGEKIKVSIEEAGAIEIRSARVRVRGERLEDLDVDIDRIEVVIGCLHGYLDKDGIEAIGYESL